MPDRTPRRPDLRASVPTLEPDDAFVARLSALAAAGAPAPAPAARPIGMWRIAFSAAGVAAVLVGVAWLAGLSPGDNPSPAPPPATHSPSAPDHTAAPPPSSTSRTTATEGQPLAPPESAASATSTGRPGHGSSAHADEHAAVGADHAQGAEHATTDETAGPSRGPNAHAGDHPNAHSTTKSNNANEHPGTPPDRGKGSKGGRSGR